MGTPMSSTPPHRLLEEILVRLETAKHQCQGEVLETLEIAEAVEGNPLMMTKIVTMMINPSLLLMRRKKLKALAFFDQIASDD